MTSRITIFRGKLAHFNHISSLGTLTSQPPMMLFPSPNANARIYEKPPIIESLQSNIRQQRTLEEYVAIHRTLLNLMSSGENVGKSNYTNKKQQSINWKLEGF